MSCSIPVSNPPLRLTLPHLLPYIHIHIHTIRWNTQMDRQRISKFWKLCDWLIPPRIRPTRSPFCQGGGRIEGTNSWPRYRGARDSSSDDALSDCKRVYSIIIGPAADYNREAPSNTGRVRGGLLLLADEGYCLGGDWMFGDRSLNRGIGIGRRDIVPRLSDTCTHMKLAVNGSRGINGR